MRSWTEHCYRSAPQGFPPPKAGLAGRQRSGHAGRMHWPAGWRERRVPVSDIRGRVAVVRRLLPARPDAVYDEWLDPGALSDRMCPRPARCRNVESEPRVAGRLQIDIEDDGVEFSVSGEYLVLDRPRQLSFSWSCTTWPDPSIKSVVNVLLEPRENEQPLMTIEHSLLPPELDRKSVV